MRDKLAEIDESCQISGENREGVRSRAVLRFRTNGEKSVNRIRNRCSEWMGEPQSIICDDEFVLVRVFGGSCAFVNHEIHEIHESREADRALFIAVRFADSLIFLLVFPLRNPARRPGRAGGFHLFLEPVQIDFDQLS